MFLTIADSEPTPMLMIKPSKPSKRPHLLEAFHKTSPSDTKSLNLLFNNFNLPCLKLSPLRPDCNLGDRLKSWTPINAQITLDDEGSPTNLGEEDLLRIKEVLDEAYTTNTRNVYSTGLFTFHFFCDLKTSARNITPQSTKPSSPPSSLSSLEPMGAVP